MRKFLQNFIKYKTPTIYLLYFNCLRPVGNKLNIRLKYILIIISLKWLINCFLRNMRKSLYSLIDWKLNLLNYMKILGVAFYIAEKYSIFWTYIIIFLRKNFVYYGQCISRYPFCQECWKYYFISKMFSVQNFQLWLTLEL